MSFFCRSTLAPVQADGFTPRARTQLLGSRKKIPHQLSFTRAEVIRYRAEVADRMSISGVQDKVSLRFEKGALIPTETAGEFILKPIPGTPLPQFTDQVPANEHLTMQIASQVFGIETAANALVTLADGEPAYITRRFDRRLVDGQIVKIDMEDFCALAEQSPDTHGRNYKYDGSYERIAELTKRFCPAYRIENEKLFQRVLFSYAFGNGDAHLKNFSLFTSQHGDPVHTPAYDFVNTNLHLPNETPLALDLFVDDFETEEFRVLGFHCGGDFLVLAERMGLVPARAARLLEDYQKVKNQDKVNALVERSFLSNEAKEAYGDVVADRLRALRQRA